MELKGWAELVHEKRVKELALLPETRRKKQVLQWIKEDGIDSKKATELWGYVLDSGDIKEEVLAQVEQAEKENARKEAMHRYEYDVVKTGLREDMGAGIIHERAKEGWRLHTYSITALDRGAFEAGFMKAFGGPGLALVNVMTLVFERERQID